MERFSRTQRLIGSENMQKLTAMRVAVFGIGGVGSFAAEALFRSGIGTLLLVDDDVVTESNINRQLIALTSTLGQPKTEVMRQRGLEINPAVHTLTMPIRYETATADQIPLADYDYIVDAIDSVTSKLLLIERAHAAGVPIISAMGAGNKLDPTAFRVADISKTSVCPLARVMRRELKKRGIERLKVVYSTEPPVSVSSSDPNEHTPGSIAFVPSVAGLILAGEVVKDLCGLSAK